MGSPSEHSVVHHRTFILPPGGASKLLSLAAEMESGVGLEKESTALHVAGR